VSLWLSSVVVQELTFKDLRQGAYRLLAALGIEDTNLVYTGPNLARMNPVIDKAIEILNH
jgi:hypothetical protein